MWKIWRFVASTKEFDAHTRSSLNMLNCPWASCQKQFKHNLWIMTWSNVSFFLLKTNLESSELVIMGSPQITIRFSTFIAFNFLTYQECTYERLGQTKNNKWPEQLPITSRFKEIWWVFSKWSGRLEKCVGEWVFTIFYWRWPSSSLGIWIVVVGRGWNFGTLWKLVFFVMFLFVFFFFFFIWWSWCYIFQRRSSRKNNNIFYCLNFRHHIINFCSHDYCCRTFELLLLLLWLLCKQTEKKNVGKMLATKMSYFRLCS